MPIEMPLQAPPAEFVPSFKMSDVWRIWLAMPSNALPWQSDFDKRPATALRPLMSASVSITPAMTPLLPVSAAV